MTIQKTQFQYQWFISTMITLLTIGATFVYNHGVQAQQMKDTAFAIEERKKVDDTIMECIKEDKKDQAQINKELISTLTDLRIALTELRAEIKAKH